MSNSDCQEILDIDVEDENEDNLDNSFDPRQLEQEYYQEEGSEICSIVIEDDRSGSYDLELPPKVQQ